MFHEAGIKLLMYPLFFFGTSLYNLMAHSKTSSKYSKDSFQDLYCEMKAVQNKWDDE